jgi:hypothetical protein
MRWEGQIYVLTFSNKECRFGYTPFTFYHKVGRSVIHTLSHKIDMSVISYIISRDRQLGQLKPYTLQHHP